MIEKEGLELDLLTQALEANLLILKKVKNDCTINDKRKLLISIVSELSKLCDNVIEPLKKDCST
tara:strand:- start:862 stop:1053 length:192 start_codon:yes stop_codon:yes gene_type:complete